MARISPVTSPTPDTFSKKTHDIYIEKLEKPYLKAKSRCPNRLVFHPESYLRMGWDVMMLLLITYQALTVPFYICFNEEYPLPMQDFEVLVNCLFFTDILLCFNTGFYEKGSLVLKRRLIFKSYIKFWFWADLVATFPYTWLIEGVYIKPSSTESNSGVYNTPKIIRIVRIIRFLRILKLLRLAKLKKILLKIEDYIASNVIASLFLLFRILCASFLVAHWIACLWFFIGSSGQDEHPITWILKASIQDSSSFDQYMTSLYWAFTTIATVGYGDIYPITMEEKIFAMSTMIISSGVFAYTLGSIGTLVSKQNALENSYRETFVSVNSYMKTKNLPKDLQFRVRRYLDYLWEKKKKNKTDEKEVLELLSEPLRDEIYGYINANILRACIVFDLFEDNFVIQFTRTLENETYAPGDSIFEEGEMSHKIYYITGGVISIYQAATQMIYKNLKNKNYFGEISFFLETKRSASAQCKEFSDLLSVNRTDFLCFLEKFPESARKVEEIVEGCRNFDYSGLGVVCYICDELGHIAGHCKAIILNYDQDEAKSNWIEERSKRKTVRVHTKSFPTYVRNRRRRVKIQNIIKNSLSGEGLKETSKDWKLIEAIGNAEKVIRKMEVGEEKVVLRPQFSLLCNSEISEDEVFEKTPKPIFGLRLGAFSTVASPLYGNIKEEEDLKITVKE